MAGNVVGKAEYQLGADLTPLKKDLGLAEGQLKQSGKVAESSFGKFRQQAMSGFGLAGGMVAFSAAQKAIGTLTSEVGSAITAASDLAESQSKVDQVFTTSSATIHDWALGAADGFGLSQRAALEAAGSVGNFTQALGLSEDASNEMSRSVVELAADLASFNNTSIEAVLGSLQSGLAGEAEPMRRLGADISAARVEALLLADGVQKVNGKFTEAQKVQGRYEAIMQDTIKAQGDFARTSDGLANSQRILDARVEDLRASLGQGLTPAAGAVVTALSGVVDVVGILIGANGNPILKQLQEHFLKVAGAAAEAADTIEGEWAGSGTVIDSALDGLNALNDLFNSSPLAPPLVTEGRKMAEAMRPFAEAVGLTEFELKILSQTAVKSGATVEEAVAAIRSDWESLTSGEQQRQRNMYLAFVKPLEKTVGEQAPAIVRESVTRILSDLSALGPGMRQTINDGKAGVAQAMRQLRWAMEHPFAGDKYAAFLEDKQRAANKKLTQAIRDGNTDAAREAAALVAAIHAELAKLENRDFSVNVALEYDPLSSIVAPAGDPDGRKKKKRRALGGPVSAGELYRVNELGTETYFRPNADGYILDAQRSQRLAAAGTTTTVNVNVSIPGATILGTPEGAQRWAREVTPAIRRELGRLDLRP